MGSFQKKDYSTHLSKLDFYGQNVHVQWRRILTFLKKIISLHLKYLKKKKDTRWKFYSNEN